MLIVDESSVAKNLQARRTRTLIALAGHFPYHLILTGTPITKSPLDVFAQCEILDPGCLGFATYLAFERAFAVYQRRRTRTHTFNEIVSYRDLEDLERRVAQIAYRATAEECLDLPPCVTRTLPVELTQLQTMTLRQLREDMMADMDGGLVDGRNILTRYLRMAQVTGGFVNVMEADGRPRELPVAFDPNPKMLALKDYLTTILEADPTRKAVIFARFIPEVKAILELCAKHGWGPVPFFGEIPPEAREEWLRRFRTKPENRVMVAQFQTGSKGLNLVEASCMIFYSLTFSLEDMLQARKRVHRKGQVREVDEVYLIGRTARGRRTIDHLTLQALRDKKSLADIVTGDRAREALEAL
jgi:SNF2 family DNA or RNA helicase